MKHSVLSGNLTSIMSVSVTISNNINLLSLLKHFFKLNRLDLVNEVEGSISQESRVTSRARGKLCCSPHQPGLVSEGSQGQAGVHP